MSPYDAIVVSAAAPSIPGPLLAQLREGGRLIIPVGNRKKQYLKRVWRADTDWHVERLLQVVFVPLIGRYGFRES